MARAARLLEEVDGELLVTGDEIPSYARHLPNWVELSLYRSPRTC